MLRFDVYMKRNADLEVLWLKPWTLCGNGICTWSFPLKNIGFISSSGWLQDWRPNCCARNLEKWDISARPAGRLCSSCRCFWRKLRLSYYIL